MSKWPFLDQFARFKASCGQKRLWAKNVLTTASLGVSCTTVNTERSDAVGPLECPFLWPYFHVLGRFFMPRRRVMQNPFAQNADNPGQNYVNTLPLSHLVNVESEVWKEEWGYPLAGSQHWQKGGGRGGNINFDQCSDEFCPGLSVFCEKGFCHIWFLSMKKKQLRHKNMALKGRSRGPTASLRSVLTVVQLTPSEAVVRTFFCPQYISILFFLVTRSFKTCKLV